MKSATTAAIAGSRGTTVSMFSIVLHSNGAVTIPASKGSDSEVNDVITAFVSEPQTTTAHVFDRLTLTLRLPQQQCGSKTFVYPR